MQPLTRRLTPTPIHTMRMKHPGLNSQPRKASVVVVTNAKTWNMTFRTPRVNFPVASMNRPMAWKMSGLRVATTAAEAIPATARPALTSDPRSGPSAAFTPSAIHRHTLTETSATACARPVATKRVSMAMTPRRVNAAEEYPLGAAVVAAPGVAGAATVGLAPVELDPGVGCTTPPVKRLEAELPVDARPGPPVGGVPDDGGVVAVGAGLWPTDGGVVDELERGVAGVHTPPEG